MIRLSCLAESKTPPDLQDIKSEIKWMEVPNQYRQILGSLPQVPAGVHAIQLFFGIVLPHGNVDPHEYKLL